MTMREVLKHIIFFGFCMVAVSAIASEARATPAWLTNHKHGVLIASKASVSVAPKHVSDSALSGVAFEMSLSPPPKQKNEVAMGLVPIVRPHPPRQLSDDPVTPPRQGSVDPVTPPRQVSGIAWRSPKKVGDYAPKQKNEVVIASVPIVRPRPRPPPPSRQVSANHVTLPSSFS